MIGASAALASPTACRNSAAVPVGPPCTAPRASARSASAPSAVRAACARLARLSLACVIVGAHADRATPASQGTSPPDSTSGLAAAGVAAHRATVASANRRAVASPPIALARCDISTSETNDLRNSRASSA